MIVRFVDSNVLIYSVSRNPADKQKKAIARQVLNNDDLVFSGQVLGEFYVQATRQNRTKPLTHSEATATIESLQIYPIVAVTDDLVLRALKIKERYQLSYWDALIVAAAKISGCEELLSEDLNDGQKIEGVLIVNPFSDVGGGSEAV
jgi:predicted nucleic acid-binding protein